MSSVIITREVKIIVDFAGHAALQNAEDVRKPVRRRDFEQEMHVIRLTVDFEHFYLDSARNPVYTSE